MSVDGVGTFDLMSRASTMSALRSAPGCDDALCPVILRPTFQQDELGEVHDIVQAG